MGGLASLAALEGTWTLTREIVHANGQRQEFDGTARFQWEGEVLVQSEEGELSGLPGHAPVRATRRYLWIQDDDVIDVKFADMRAFHRIPLGVERPEATHFCPPDTYRVHYDFSDPLRWHARWSVEGPRKCYVMSSVFTATGQSRRGAEALASA